VSVRVATHCWLLKRMFLPRVLRKKTRKRLFDGALLLSLITGETVKNGRRISSVRLNGAANRRCLGYFHRRPITFGFCFTRLLLVGVNFPEYKDTVNLIQLFEVIGRGMFLQIVTLSRYFLSNNLSKLNSLQLGYVLTRQREVERGQCN